MFKRFLCACAAASSLLFCSVFSGMCLNASADNTPYIRMTSNTLASYIGNTVDAYYLANDDTMKHFTLTVGTFSSYVSSVSSQDNTYALTGSQIIAADGYLPSDAKLVGNLYPAIDVYWNVHFSNVKYFDSAAFVTRASAMNKTNIFFNGTWDSFATSNYWTVGANTSSVGSLISSSSGANPGYFLLNNLSSSTHKFCARFIHYLGDPIDFYLGIAHYSCVSYDNSGYIQVGITCPAINSDYVFEGNEEMPSISDDSDTPSFDGDAQSVGTASGTISDDGNGGQNINVTVETDNTGLVGSILSGIKNLFVPTSEDLQAFSDDMQDIADEHLGGLYQAVDMLTDAFDGIDDLDARQSIHVQSVSIPLLRGDSLTLGNWDIPLKPSNTGGFAVLYTGIALITDFIAGFAFLRMCKNKLHIILNPESEVVQE